ncbi:MAG: hypothetical protein OXL96_06835 [Candidatus Poribacteria bacterium]|nr:hypothetical protein [Candidatus Poribacteria bacterium]
MKWFLSKDSKDFAIPFGLGLMCARFFDSLWFLFAVVFVFYCVLSLVEWILKRNDTSWRFPAKGFLILSVFVFFFGRFIDSGWLLLVIVIPSVGALFFISWLLKRKTESEPEQV